MDDKKPDGESGLKIRKQVKWIDENPEAVSEWLKEQELYYRTTDYRG